MPDTESAQKMLERFERSEEYNEHRLQDSDDVLRQFRFWQDRPVTQKQKIVLMRYAEKQDIPISYRAKKIVYKEGISKRKGISKEELRRHYTTHKVKGKSRIVARIPKGLKGAGRFAKKS